MRSKYISLFFISNITLFLLFICSNTYAFFRLRQLKKSAYRSEDKYSLPRKNIYMPNIDSKEINLYGDLCALGGFNNNCNFSDGKRTHRFKTDSFGYKTLGNLNNSEIAIIGDSFLAASGGDEMNQQLGSVLEKLSKKKIYEAAHPGDIYDYNKRHRFLKKKNPKLKFIYLIFEGNDFYRKNPNEYHTMKNYSNLLIRKIRQLPIYKLYYLTIESKKLIKKDNVDSIIRVLQLPNIDKNKAFYLPYILNSNKKDIRITDNEYNYIFKNKNSICGIIYTPTAYSVYFGKKDLFSSHPFLNKQLENLSREGIQFVDLTTPLRKAAKLEIINGPIWWSDDTHWNFAAIKIAAIKTFNELNCLKD